MTRPAGTLVRNTTAARINHWITAGCFILLGAGMPDAPVESCHSPRFDFNDRLIPVVVRLWADLAGLPPR